MIRSECNLAKDVDALVRRAAMLENHNDIVCESYNNTLKQLDAECAKSAELEDQLQELREDYNSATARLNKAIFDLQNKVIASENQSEGAELRDQLQELQEHYDDLQKDYIYLQGKLGESENQSLEADQMLDSAMLSQLNAYKMSLCDLENRNMELNRQLAEAEECEESPIRLLGQLESVRRQLAEAREEREYHKKGKKEYYNRLVDAEADLARHRIWLNERNENADRNRQWCDDASNFLGPFAQVLKRWYDCGEELMERVQEIDEAYHQVGCKYPWVE